MFLELKGFVYLFIVWYEIRRLFCKIVFFIKYFCLYVLRKNEELKFVY